ncbi:MAG: GGDEF domain-containing protein [Ruminiclostridium sp.]|nr:GGDEF domain-containing protein [Ruminiclostridium sp.]
MNNDKFERIAEALLSDYSSVYYVDAATGEYSRYLIDPVSNVLRLGSEGKDFFGDMKKLAERIVFEDDREAYIQRLNMDAISEAADNRSEPRVEYRIVLDGKPVWHTVRIIRGVSAGDNDYFIFGVINIDREVRERSEIAKIKKEREVYDRIAETLASNYDVVYYVDMTNNSYAGLTTNNIFGTFSVADEGRDFFADAPKNALRIIHPHDFVKFVNTVDKDFLIAQLDLKKKVTLNYRMVVDGKTQYTRLTAVWTSDMEHIVIGVENIDGEIRKEREHLKALNSEKELARRDDLTGTKNKTAYLELTRSIQDNIDSGINYLTFAIVVCDINGLKQINDTQGHKAGDEYIKACADLIRQVFANSPVFRIGGDEFVVFVRGGDYAFKTQLFEKLRKEVLDNLSSIGKPVIASGMSAYDPAADKGVSEVFDRADAMMYENKRELKSGNSV